MPEFNWSNPQFENSTFMKWASEGDSIEGVITGMSSFTYPAKGEIGMPDYQAPQTFPVLVIDTAAGEKELTVSAVDLLQKTKAKNPQVGDWYSAAWVATAGKKRIFLVVVKKEAKYSGVGDVAAVDANQAAITKDNTVEIPF